MSGLTHFTAAPFTFDPNRVYQQRRPTFKPEGLWLSVDGEHGWKEWCEGEQWGIDGLSYETPFQIREGANVLRLSTLDEIRALPKRFPLKETYLDGWVDWKPVIEQYDGILVTPYVWEARYDIATSWYYPWDCASGCFWNLASVEPLAKAVAA